MKMATVLPIGGYNEIVDGVETKFTGNMLYRTERNGRKVLHLEVEYDKHTWGFLCFFHEVKRDKKYISEDDIWFIFEQEDVFVSCSGCK